MVIPQQPILAYKETSLDQDWAMLLEGERQRFTLTVSNLSPVAAENVVLKLTDSITENLKHALQRKGLSAREIYDLEHALFEQQQPLKWIRNDVSETVSVPGYGQATFEIEITGRHDLEQAFVGIEYTAAADETWIRTLTVPINLTVTPSVELVNFELLPLQPNGNAANPELFRKLDPIKHCLLVLDVLNHLPTTAVDLRFKHAKGRTQQRIKPTCTARILVPIITTHTPSANDEEVLQLRIMQLSMHLSHQLLRPASLSLMQLSHPRKLRYWPGTCFGFARPYSSSCNTGCLTGLLSSKPMMTTTM